MSGGVAFVLDEQGSFERLCNRDMVSLEAVESEEDIALLRGTVERHLRWTESTVAERVLNDWDGLLPRFIKVMPNDLKRVLEERQEAELEAVS
jgi:glutamate synthase domain-containing protein 3